ncbi:MAG: hypothetical protein HQM04_08870 [Magnetococcales bacterium]|nr:hypothetical protein [Magnetococcales bacterium]MBF0115145.1 hypothetical protein [Magnetococcales bacterium]
MPLLLFALLLLWTIATTAWADEAGVRLPTTPPPVATQQPPRLQRLLQQPVVHLGPPQMPQTAYNADLAQRMRHLLQYGDFILAPDSNDHGYIQSVNSQRPLQVGASVSLVLTQATPPGTLFTVYRPGLVLHDPRTGQPRGTVAQRLGQLQLRASTPHDKQGDLTSLLQEIQPGDRLLQMAPPLPEPTPHTQSDRALHGVILALQEEWEEAGQDQVAIVSLGRQDRVAPGLQLRLQHQLPPGNDPYSHAPLPPRTEPSGEAILVWVGEWASLALLGPTAYPVSRGDSVSSR